MPSPSRSRSSKPKIRPGTPVRRQPDVRLSVRVTPDLLRAVDAFALGSKVSRSSIAKRALESLIPEEYFRWPLPRRLLPKEHRARRRAS